MQMHVHPDGAHASEMPALCAYVNGASASLWHMMCDVSPHEAFAQHTPEKFHACAGETVDSINHYCAQIRSLETKILKEKERLLKVCSGPLAAHLRVWHVSCINLCL